MPATVRLDLKEFNTKMNNLVGYSNGFVEGIHAGKSVFVNSLGASTIAAIYSFIDANARMNPEALHHVYEWYNTGSPSARLFDLDYVVSNYGLAIRSNFKQSQSVSSGSTTPFYNKAEIMENGIPITISPKKKYLVFDINGETVFTSKAVTIDNPGGPLVQGSYERVFNQFMLQYFKQSFLKASGIYNYLQNPLVYKTNLNRGLRSGNSYGKTVGYKWIANARVGSDG